MANGVKIDRERLKPVPVGKSDWAGFCQKNYAAEMAAGGVTDILKLGLAYYKKNVEFVS